MHLELSPLKQLISSSVTSTKQLSAILKNLLGDYRVIITSSATNPCREFSIITYVIILKNNITVLQNHEDFEFKKLLMNILVLISADSASCRV